MFDIGLSSCGKVLNEELFAAYASAGISAMEVSPDPWRPDIPDFWMLKKYSEKYGIRLWSYHLPFGPFERIDPSSLSAEVRENTLSLFTRIIESASAIGIDKFIVHPSGEPIDISERPQRLEASKDTLSRLADIAAEHGAVICVEDLPRTCLGNCSDEINHLISADERLRVCFDTNHLLSENAVDFINSVSERIVTLHVSDYDFINERHWLPGEGKVDWASLIDALKVIGYEGVWMYELGFKTPPSIIRSRDLTCEDFSDNAKAIFASQKPAKI